MRKLLFLLPILLLSCHHLKKGVIQELWHRDAYTTTSFMMVGKVMVPTTEYHPESWGCDLMGDYHGHKIIEEVGLSQRDFYSLKEGDTITLK